MASKIRVVVEKLNEQGDVIDKAIVSTKDVDRPQSIIDLGFRHDEQIQLLHEIQRELLNEQSVFLRDHRDTCPRCGSVLKKKGLNRSDFYAVFTDHKVATQRLVCPHCRWSSIPSVSSLFGTSMHPDLTKLQTEMGATHSFRQAQSNLNMIVNRRRKANHHHGIKQRVESIGMFASSHKQESPPVDTASEIILQVDGGHLKTNEDQHSIEALAAVVYRPESVEYSPAITRKDEEKNKDEALLKPRGIIKRKHCAASALADDQQTIREQTLCAARNEGMTHHTKVTAICDGAENCWSVVDSIRPYCAEITSVLDWFHIGMRFQNCKTGDDSLNKRLMGAKWYLWNGKAEQALERLQGLLLEKKLPSKSAGRIKKLSRYIKDNRSHLVNYKQRYKAGLVISSQMAESTVESLINQRCKGKKHMRWSREGVQAVLSVRAAICSGNWLNLWDNWVQETLVHRAA